MYVWKTGSLSEDIKKNTISQKEWKKYYLAVSTFMTLAMYLTAISPRDDLMAVMIEAILIVGILIFGVNITYKSNKGDSGSDYIPRMTALSLPILIKLFLLSLLFGVLLGFLSEAFSLSESVIEWLTVCFVVLVQVLFFWRINTHIKYINA